MDRFGIGIEIDAAIQVEDLQAHVVRFASKIRVLLDEIPIFESGHHVADQLQLDGPCRPIHRGVQNDLRRPWYRQLYPEHDSPMWVLESSGDNVLRVFRAHGRAHPDRVDQLSEFTHTRLRTLEVPVEQTFVHYATMDPWRDGCQCGHIHSDAACLHHFRARVSINKARDIVKVAWWLRPRQCRLIVIRHIARRQEVECLHYLATLRLPTEYCPDAWDTKRFQRQVQRTKVARNDLRIVFFPGISVRLVMDEEYVPEPSRTDKDVLTQELKQLSVGKG
mmetsp:Transcript_21464/g.57205  ORF Transcript_21464/g.57205 Transcript_21464/m.57205 type:complete len:278 (-) Transcript_21464:1160-1993(-)